MSPKPTVLEKVTLKIIDPCIMFGLFYRKKKQLNYKAEKLNN